MTPLIDAEDAAGPPAIGPAVSDRVHDGIF